MAGAAGGALQTAQRIGGALGTALLATVYYHGLSGTARGLREGVSAALFSAAGLVLLALLVAVAELIARGRRLPPEPSAGTGLRVAARRETRRTEVLTT
jgi:hypothetical protein